MPKMLTEKQKQSHRRNHLILRLRGCYQLFNELDSLTGMKEVDKQLMLLSAEPETERRDKE